MHPGGHLICSCCLGTIGSQPGGQFMPNVCPELENPIFVSFFVCLFGGKIKNISN